MKKILSITTILLLTLMLLISIAATDYESEAENIEFDFTTPLGSAPNVIGSDTYQNIEAPLIPTGLISTAAQTNDNANVIILVGLAAVSLTGVCFIAFTANKKNRI